MSVEVYQRKTQQLRNDIARLESKRATTMKSEADLRSAAGRTLAGISKSISPSTAEGRIRGAESKQRAADRERDKVVDLQKQIARKQTDLAAAEKSLSVERERAEKARAQAARKEADSQRRRREEEAMRSEHRARENEQEVTHLQREVGTLRTELTDVKSALARELPSVTTVLLMFSDPAGSLRLDREMRAIHDAVRLSEQRDHVKLEQRWAARPGDIPQAILETRPSVVHFSGHGTGSSELVFEGDDGTARVIEPADLAGLVKAIGESVRVILYNACWSAEAANAIAERVDVAIGMDAPVTDGGARAFAEGFYRAVGAGRSVAAAFEVGRFELRNSPARRATEAEPVMVSRDGVDPASVFLVAPPAE